MSGGEGSRDFLQILLQMKDEEDAKTPFTMTHLKALLMVCIIDSLSLSPLLSFSLSHIRMLLKLGFLDFFSLIQLVQYLSF